MKRSIAYCFGLIALQLALMAFYGTAFGYSRYENAATDPGVNCRSCHNDNRAWIPPTPPPAPPPVVISDPEPAPPPVVISDPTPAPAPVETPDPTGGQSGSRYCRVDSRGSIHIPGLDIDGESWDVELELDDDDDSELRWVVSRADRDHSRSHDARSSRYAAFFGQDGVLHLPALDLSELGIDALLNISLRLESNSHDQAVFRYRDRREDGHHGESDSHDD